ncbi:hypothetical protein [Bradyrhizobium ivorense]|uniref:hypothetical protein n=1 Tax=Bradyrhizobium ivorense TaxID=2511166 RepID=UPI0010B5DBD7|nr:hypothetical protein [Bradyrhizobium ivorense]VIO75037.1 hypothetical protein CI41S_45420 [Bradyrhizobium ivorense]
MSPRSARGRLAAPTFRFTPQGPIEPALPVVLHSLLFLATLALPFVVALFAA